MVLKPTRAVKLREGGLTAQVHTQYCILWGWHDATGDQNTENEKKYLWEEKIFGRRDEGKTNWTFVAKHLLHLFYLSVQCCTFCRDVFVRGKWSDDNEYVVMLRVRRRRVVISYIICNWSQSIVSISPWSPPSPTPPHLGMEDCTLYVQRYYLLIITWHWLICMASVKHCILLLTASNKVFVQFCWR